MRVGGQHSDAGIDDGQGSVDQGQSADDDQEVEPEPEEDVDLFVDDVDWQNAHGIVSLDVAGGAISVECTLGESWRHFDASGWKSEVCQSADWAELCGTTYHWIVANRPVPVGEVKHFQAVAGKLSAQESVDEHHLENDVEQVEHFGDGVGEEQCIMQGHVSV